MKKKPEKLEKTSKLASKGDYDAEYRKKNPLLTTHVPLSVYNEVKKRALEDRRSISKWLAIFLEKAFPEVKVAK